MAEKRLSKLQKWILNRCLTNAKRDMESNVRGKGRGYIYREEIYYDFFRLPYRRYGTFPRAKVVTVSRSLKNLKEKGFITIPDARPKGYLIFLSEEYVKVLNAVARKMRMLNVNNKSTIRKEKK